MTLCLRSLLALVLVVSIPVTLLAQGDRERARELFARGEELYGEEKWEEALAEFEASFEEIEHVATRFNIAKCLERLGRLVEGDRAYANVQDEDDGDLARDATNARSRIALLLATLKVTVDEDDLEVTIDGEACALPCERKVDPGDHDVVIGTGDDTRTLTVSLQEGEVRTVGSGPAAESVGIDLDLGSTPASSGGIETDRLLLWGGVAVAGVGLTMTTIFGLRASKLESDVEEARTSGPDPDDVDAGETAATLANVGLVVMMAGVGLAATGLVLGLDEGEESDDPSTRVHLVPGGLVLSGSLP